MERSKRLLAHFSRKWIIIAAAGLVVIAVGAAWYRQNDRLAPMPSVPVSMSNALLFTPLVPGWLPEGYAVEVASYSVSGQVLVFSAIKNDGRPIVVSQQPFPKNFDVNGFYEANLEGAKRLDGARYPVVFGGAKKSDGSVASVTVGDVWVLMTMPDSLGEQDAIRLAGALAPSR